MLRLGDPPITQWAVMKANLQEKYIPPSYKSQLFSTMINLKQMTLSVTEYSVKFEEARLRCSEFHAEDQFAVCTRFINGLWFDIQRMVRLHAPHTVEDAYKKDLEVEKFNRPSSFAHTSKSKSKFMSSDGNTMPNNIRSTESSLRNSLPVASPIASKASSSSIVCHKCHHKGHIASRCPQRALELNVEQSILENEEDQIIDPLDYSCNDPYQIIQVFNKFDQVDQPIVGGAKLNFSRMNNFGLTKTPFRRPRRYEFIDRLNVKIRLTDKKLWS